MESTVDRTEGAFVADVVGVGARASRRSELARVSLGAGLSFVFALAAGAAHPTLDLPARALLVPFASVASALFALPSLAILLALFGVEVPAATLLAAASRGVATTGLVLAGLAPLSLLYTTTAPDGLATVLVFVLALGLAFLLGLRATFGELHAWLRPHAGESLAPIAVLAIAASLAAMVAVRILSSSIAGVLLGGGAHASF